MPAKKAARKSAVRTISGTLDQLIFSPKGSIEGLLVGGGDTPIQVTMPPHIGDLLVRRLQVGEPIALRVGREDRSDNDEIHPVHELIAALDASGKAINVGDATDGRRKVEGVVARLNYAKHGEANGVVLETGEFVHLKPDGMARTGLAVGDTVRATGNARPTVLGGLVLEADTVNGKRIGDKKRPKH